MKSPLKAEPALRAKRSSATGPLGPHGEIGSKLRALYAELEQEPIPADLIDLLEKLDDAEKQTRG